MNKAANVQGLLQQHFDAYSHSHKLDGQRLKVCRHLLSCHTPALGGIQYQCDHCQSQVPQYHSCRAGIAPNVSNGRVVVGVSVNNRTCYL